MLYDAGVHITDNDYPRETTIYNTINLSVKQIHYNMRFTVTI